MEKLKLAKICEHKNIEIYGNDFYRVKIENYEDNEYKIDIERIENNVPNIFARMEHYSENRNNKFRVKSVEAHLESRGFKKVDEIATVIENYTIAMKSAKEIEKLLEVK